ncbi:hypothetical protein [Rhodococcus sp. ACPA1]|uniref:hypothetical protein n=1 Tax=Rhodococcus sp. ACPA1 TaxID=2028572 RepID=UPI0018D3EE09|nr:hypothetical protein [Rhodococcus sp. ACPA1]
MDDSAATVRPDAALNSIEGGAAGRTVAALVVGAGDALETVTSPGGTVSQRHELSTATEVLWSLRLPARR